MFSRSYLILAPAAALFAFGLAVALGGRRYGIGSLTAMGPGFMPVLLGVLLMLLALAQLLGQERKLAETETVVSGLPLRPLIYCAGSLLLWALLVERAGFIPAAVAQLLLASLAVRQDNWRQAVIAIVVMSGVAYVLFVSVLGLPVSAFGV